jgi:uncharacterized protein YaiL (DUF2058 family)
VTTTKVTSKQKQENAPFETQKHKRNKLYSEIEDRNILDTNPNIYFYFKQKKKIKKKKIDSLQINLTR